MPRNGSGTYTLPSGNPVVTGTVISSTVHNNTMSDLATEMTNSTDKDGQTTITGDWDFNANAIIMDLDGDSKIDMSTDDRFDLTLGGVLELSLTAVKADNLDDIAALTPANSNLLVGDGTDWVLESGATLRASLGLTIGTDVQAFGAVLDDLNTLGAPTTDGEFLVATDAGVFAYETGATARTSMGAQETLSGVTLTAVTVATGDKVLIQDVSDSDNLKTVTAQSIADLATPSGALVLIEAQTAATDTELDFITGIDSTYDEYELHLLNFLSSSDNDILSIRTSSDTGVSFDTGGSDYRSSYGGFEAGSTKSNSATNATLITLMNGVGNASGELGVSCVIKIIRPSESTFTNISATGMYTRIDSLVGTLSASGTRREAGVVDGIRVFYGTGTSSGRGLLYGVKKA